MNVSAYDDENSILQERKLAPGVGNSHGQALLFVNRKEDGTKLRISAQGREGINQVRTPAARSHCARAGSRGR